MRRLVLSVAFMVLGLVAAGSAEAATCEARMSDLTFGAVSLKQGSVHRTSGTLTVSCSNAVLPVGVCVRFGPGSGGAGSNNAPRYMVGPTGQRLAWQMRLGGHGQAFGTLNEVFVSVPILLGSGQVTIPVYAEILANGTEFDAGLYQSLFSGAPHVEMSYGILSCELFAQSRPVPDFRVTAETVASCELEVGTMNFGRISSLAGRAVDAQASVDVRCTSGAAYTVSMGMGNGAGVTDPAFRRMSSGYASLTYGLFRDGGHSLPWGEAPSQRATGSGSGYTQRYNVFGRIYPDQPTPIGTYGDSVVVTVHY